MSISAETALQMFDNLSTAVMLFDKDLHLSCINNACEDLLSVSKRRVIGQTPQEIIPQYPVLADTIERTLKTGSPYTERSLTLTLPNSRSVTVDCKVTPIMNGDACSEVIVELIDAVSLHRIMREENLEILHDAARESVRGIAHEIKNQLGGIRGAAQLLERELNNEDSGLVEYTQIIIHEADRLRNFIDRMLVSDRKLKMGKVNIHELLEYVCSLVEAEFDESYEIIRDYDPSLPLLSADREQVIQAVLNIMRNAVQALGTDGHIWLRTRVLRQITIQKRIHRLVVRLDIIDDGPGIPAEIEKGIFYPMITGRAEGTGLGLSIAQSLVKLHGGSIEYERKDEKTVFSIYLPMEQNHV